MRNGEVVTAEKRNALRLIRQYLNLRLQEPVYYNDEKDAHYRFAIVVAMREIRDKDDTPLNVLDSSHRKYDEWAHRKCQTSCIYSIAASAIDDLIDYILSDA